MTRRLLLFAIAAVSLVAMPAYARRRAITPRAPSPCVSVTLAAATYANLMAADEQYVYVLNEMSELLRIPKLGGEPEALYSGFFDWLPLSMAVDATAIYIGVLPSDAVLSPKPGMILSVPKTGGTPGVLVSGVLTPYAIVADATHLYWVAAGTFDFVDGTIAADGKIERARKDGSERLTLADNLSVPLGIALDGNDVYFGESGLGEGKNTFGLFRVAKSGGTIATLNDRTSVGPMVLDGNTFVFLGINETVGAAIMALEKNGTAPRLLYETDEANTLAVADRRVYFLQESEGAGMELAWVSIDAPAGASVALRELDGDSFLLDGCAAIVNTIDGDLVRRPR